MKRTMAWLLALALVAGLFPAVAGADEGLPQARVFVNQGEVANYPVFLSGDELFFSGEDLAAITGYLYTNEGGEATFTRGAKTIRIAAQERMLYLEGTSSRAPRQIPLAAETIPVDAQGRYYFPGSEVLPWLNVTCGEKDGVLFIAADAGSYWDIIGEFDPQAFDFDFEAICAQLEVSGKWAKASAYVRDNGLGMLLDLIYLDFGLTVGDSMDYMAIFEDLLTDVSCSPYAYQKMIESTARFKTMSELLRGNSELSALPDVFRPLGVYSELGQAAVEALDYIIYFENFQNDNTLKLLMLDTLTLSYSAYSELCPPALWFAASETRDAYQDFWKGFTDRLVNAILEGAPELLVGKAAKDTILENLLGLFNLSIDVSPNWVEGVARISDYQVLADFALQIHKDTTVLESMEKLEKSIASAILYLYAQECNFRAMSAYAWSKGGRIAQSRELAARADEAERWQGYFLAAYPSVKNDSIEYSERSDENPAGEKPLKTGYAQELLDMFSRVEKHLLSVTPPEGMAQGDYRQQYEGLIRSFEWLQHATFDHSMFSPADYPQLGWGSYYFHDVNGDGTEELILIAGTSQADADCLVYSHGEDGIALCGSVRCGMYSMPWGSAGTRGLILVDEHGGMRGEVVVDVSDAGLEIIEIKEYDVASAHGSLIPDGWSRLEEHSIYELVQAGGAGG